MPSEPSQFPPFSDLMSCFLLRWKQALSLEALKPAWLPVLNTLSVDSFKLGLKHHLLSEAHPPVISWTTEIPPKSAPPPPPRSSSPHACH